jgi:hypothetical protein
VRFLPIGIAENEPVPPKKKRFEERAWFKGFYNNFGDMENPILQI